MLIVLAPTCALVLLRAQRNREALFIAGFIFAMMGVVTLMIDDTIYAAIGTFMLISGIFGMADPIGTWLFHRSKPGQREAHNAIVSQEIARLEQHLVDEQFNEIMDVRLPRSQKRRMLHDEQGLERHDPVIRSRKLSIPKLRIIGDAPLSRSDKIWLFFIGSSYVLAALWTIFCLIMVTFWNLQDLLGR